MEVQKVNKVTNHKIQAKEKELTDSVSFTEVMGKRKQDLNYERLSKMMSQIEEQGKILGKHQTVDALKKYKILVKKFMDDAVKNGLELQEQRGFNRRGSSKVYKIVKEVDSKLVDLTNEVLSKEKEGLRILSMVGEIQGLLVNIYT